MKERLPPSKAIRAYCLNCGEGTFNAVKNCDNTTCILHPYRHGRKKLFEGGGGMETAVESD